MLLDKNFVSLHEDPFAELGLELPMLGQGGNEDPEFSIVEKMGITQLSTMILDERGFRVPWNTRFQHAKKYLSRLGVHQAPRHILQSS